MGAGRALARMVITHQGQYAPMLGGAGMVGVAKHVTRAIEAWTLAVPHPEHPIILALTPELRLLRAPQGRGCEVLVEAGHELDVVLFQDAPRTQHGCLEGGDRGAAVTRHVARGIETRPHVPGTLNQHQAHDRLGAGQELPALVEAVLVVEAYGVLWHGGFQLRAWSAWGGLMVPSGSATEMPESLAGGKPAGLCSLPLSSTRNMATDAGAGNARRKWN